MRARVVLLLAVIAGAWAMDDLQEGAIWKVEELWQKVDSRVWEVANREGGLGTALALEFLAMSDLINEMDPKSVPMKGSFTKLWEWGIVKNSTETIDMTFNSFSRALLERREKDVRQLWRGLADQVLHDSPPIATQLDMLQEITTNRIGGYENFFDIIISKENNDHNCDMQQSPQQLLYNMYNAIQLAELKAYTMIQHSWMFLRLAEKGNFSKESDELRNHYIEKLAQQAAAVRRAMLKGKREIWKCDPRDHVPGTTYTELTKLLQGYIVNEVDLNEENTCRENCPYYKYTKQYSCYKDNYCKKQKVCKGKIVDCKFVDSDMWICPSGGGSHRRYDWIEYESGSLLGTKKSCSRAVTKVDSWWRWLFWHCSYCICLCDERDSVTSDRFFSLRTVTSDVSQNRVVTGLRFVKRNRVIHLQIQEGEMLPKGSINKSTIAWKPVDEFNINDATEGLDYHRLTYENRAFDLDDLLGPTGSVLTGLRIRTIGTHLNLEILVSQFNDTSGKLTNGGKNSQWISNDNTDGSLHNPRIKVSVEESDVPTRSTQGSKVMSKHDTYVQFTNSDLHMDVAQSTVPFIDIQPVTGDPPLALAGAGIHLKGARFYGGFIAPKIFTLDLLPYVNDNFTQFNSLTSK